MSKAAGTGRRRRGRELAMRVLFATEGQAQSVDAELEYQAEDLGAAPDVRRFAIRLAQGYLSHQEEIDARLREAGTKWNLEEMGKVERAILRMGAYELMYEQETPVAVCIDESLELTRMYAGEEAVPFVNGVLGEVARKR